MLKDHCLNRLLRREAIKAHSFAGKTILVKNSDFETTFDFALEFEAEVWGNACNAQDAHDPGQRQWNWQSGSKRKYLKIKWSEEKRPLSFNNSTART